MLQARSRRRIYWVHAVWTANLFVYLVIAWWIFYRWRNQPQWNFYLFVFVLISPTILYLASLVLFPREDAADESINYKTHFYANHRAFFILMALFGPVDVVDSLLKGVRHFLELGLPYMLSSVLFLIGLSIAATTRNERFHKFYAVFFIIQTAVISFTLFRTLV
jgi:hypothetical protein